MGSSRLCVCHDGLPRAFECSHDSHNSLSRGIYVVAMRPEVDPKAFVLAQAVAPPALKEYLGMCDAAYDRLVHSNLSAHVVWEILEFLRVAGEIFLPNEKDLLM